MTAAPTFGVMLPSFAGSGRSDSSGLRQTCQRIEALGFDSIWAIDHFLGAPMYGQTWLDPLLTLTFAAASTSAVKVGSGVLVLPLRNPVQVARDVAALQLLSDNRFVLGVGAGWNPLEFSASQIPREERGRRTDEGLQVLRLLLGGQPASHEGRFYRFPELTITPVCPPPPIWVGGGSQPQTRGSTAEGASVPESVIRRIAAADGWIAPSTSPPDLIARDWRRIQAAAAGMGRASDSIVFAHMNSIHLVDTDDRDLAYREQREAFGRYLGPNRPWEFARECYLLGSLPDVIEGIRRRIEVGITYFILGPVVAGGDEVSRQLELLRRRVIPALTGAGSGN